MVITRALGVGRMAEPMDPGTLAKYTYALKHYLSDTYVFFNVILRLTRSKRVVHRPLGFGELENGFWSAAVFAQELNCYPFSQDCLKCSTRRVSPLIGSREGRVECPSVAGRPQRRSYPGTIGATNVD